jgi:inorganic phosphate transporter, PiT family
MGANDVSNASGALVGTGTFGPLAAGASGGAGIALGALTWGKPLLRRVAFEIVEVDRAMATAAQLVQAGVVLAAVAFGFFTSMNQALVGAMAGAGFARGRETVHLSTLLSILQGWVLGPAASIGAGYAFGLLVR